MKTDVLAAVKQLCDEKKISLDSVIETIQMALAAAYRKDFGNKLQNIRVEFDPKTANFRVFDVKVVMEAPLEEEEEIFATNDEAATDAFLDPQKALKKMDDREAEVTGEEEEIKFNPKFHIIPEEARAFKKDSAVGEEIRIELEVPGEFGRMAAQTAKQVIIQRIREVERQTIFEEFKNKEKQMINAVVQRTEGHTVFFDLGKTLGILPASEQIRGEHYANGQRLKVVVLLVNKTPKGPEILLSRTHPAMVRELFYIEVPEIQNGGVEIMGIAREAGSRSKIAVRALEENIDPIGSCVGQRGSRVQTIIHELGGEKVDIIEYQESLEKFIAAALAPAKVSRVELTSEADRFTKVFVKADQQSLAIGKGGQNVRLAAQLTGWKIDILPIEALDAGEKEIEKSKGTESATGSLDPASFEAVAHASDEPADDQEDTPAKKNDESVRVSIETKEDGVNKLE